MAEEVKKHEKETKEPKETKEAKETADKKTAIKTAVSTIEKQFGKGSIMVWGDGSAERNIEIIPTSAINLDIALGIGGYPKGRIVEIYGQESSGKTTLALHAIAEAQKQNGIAAFIDAEHALDVNYAKKLGVKVDELLISQPDYGEQALDIAETLVRSGQISIIVVDSVAALTPKAELEGEMGDHHMGLQARLMSQALRKLTASISKSKCNVIFINQIRMKIGVFFGNPETTTGGNALKFYASQRIEVRRLTAIKQGEENTGIRVMAKVVKNKLAPPFKNAEFDIMYGTGISRSGCVLDMAEENKLIEKSGTWYSYKNQRLGQGRENVKQYLEENPSILSELEIELKKQFGLTSPVKNQKD